MLSPSFKDGVALGKVMHGNGLGSMKWAPR